MKQGISKENEWILKRIDQVYGWDKKPMKQPTKKELDDFCVEFKEYISRLSK